MFVRLCIYKDRLGLEFRRLLAKERRGVDVGKRDTIS